MAVTVLPAGGSPVAKHRRALFAACAGNAMEWYDFALFGAAATILAAVLAPGGRAGFIAVFAVFAAARAPRGPLRPAARARGHHLADGPRHILVRTAATLVDDRAGGTLGPAGIARGAGVLGRR